MSWNIEVSGSGPSTQISAASEQDVLEQVTTALKGKAAEISIKTEPVDLSEAPALPTLDEQFWRTLVRRIKAGLCTPFLGAGVNEGIVPLGGEIAETWAKENAYPLPDARDLAKVAQFMALTGSDLMDCKEELLERWFTNVNLPPAKPPDQEDQPLRFLASLPIPVYLTTNYDNLMCRALSDAGKTPRRELCKWNSHPKVLPWKSVWNDKRGFKPTKDEPLVYHLHGIDTIYESLVLTEDDYLDFLVAATKESQKADQKKNALLPPAIQEALAGSSILFVGYGLADWTFRVLYRGLLSSIEPGQKRASVAVQLAPGSPNNRVKVEQYLVKYFGNMDVKCYWGRAQQFTTALKEKLKQYG
jgi:SIR2-like domain